MKMDIDKEMNLYIGEDFFEFTDDRYDGFCYPGIMIFLSDKK